MSGEHGFFPTDFSSFVNFDINRGGLGFDGGTKTVTKWVPSKNPEGKTLWREVKVTVPKKVEKSPPPAFPHSDDPKQLPLPKPK